MQEWDKMSTIAWAPSLGTEQNKEQTRIYITSIFYKMFTYVYIYIYLHLNHLPNVVCAQVMSPKHSVCYLEPRVSQQIL